jgi:hypothetical protein
MTAQAKRRGSEKPRDAVAVNSSSDIKSIAAQAPQHLRLAHTTVDTLVAPLRGTRRRCRIISPSLGHFPPSKSRSPTALTSDPTAFPSSGNAARPPFFARPYTAKSALRNWHICAFGPVGEILCAGSPLFGHNPGVVLPKLEQRHNKLGGART